MIGARYTCPNPYATDEERTEVHEAGHLVIALAEGRQIYQATVVPTDGALGSVSFVPPRAIRASTGDPSTPSTIARLAVRSHQDLAARLRAARYLAAHALGGLAAEATLLGRRTPWDAPEFEEAMAGFEEVYAAGPAAGLLLFGQCWAQLLDLFALPAIWTVTATIADRLRREGTLDNSQVARSFLWGMTRAGLIPGLAAA